MDYQDTPHNFNVDDFDAAIIGDGRYHVIFEGSSVRAGYAAAEIVNRIAKQIATEGDKSQAARLVYLRSCLEYGSAPSKRSCQRISKKLWTRMVNEISRHDVES